MSVRIDKGTALSNLSLTPLIDVVFLLLIFFLVATRFAEEAEEQLNLQLAEASEAMPLTAQPNELIVNITKEGRFVVGGERLTLQELENTLRRATAVRAGRVSVLIRVDRRCPFQFVTAAGNACVKARIRDYVTVMRDPNGPE